VPDRRSVDQPTFSRSAGRIVDAREIEQHEPSWKSRHRDFLRIRSGLLCEPRWLSRGSRAERVEMSGRVAGARYLAHATARPRPEPSEPRASPGGDRVENDQRCPVIQSEYASTIGEERRERQRHRETASSIDRITGTSSLVTGRTVPREPRHRQPRGRGPGVSIATLHPRPTRTACGTADRRPCHPTV
jgi:hypothetical protein